jgi:hypothetical protein
MAPRVSVEELLGAADWLRAYEGPDGVIGDHGAGGDERAVELLRVAEWLDAEIERRRSAAVVREVVARTGCSPARARAALARRNAEAGV